MSTSPHVNCKFLDFLISKKLTKFIESFELKISFILVSDLRIIKQSIDSLRKDIHPYHMHKH